MKKYNKKERLRIYRAIRRYIKANFLFEDIYLCAVLEYDILNGEGGTIEDFPELIALKPKNKGTSNAWGPNNGTRQERNTYRLNAINQVISDMTTKKSI